MKILAISCSPRKSGNTVTLLNQALVGAKADGADTELFTVAGKNIEPCLACRTCGKDGICAQKDDMQLLYDKILEADGIIFGTPVYFYTVTAQCKSIMDRTIALNHPDRNMANKVGGIVVVAGSQGNITAVKDLYFYFVSRQMLAANFISAYAGAEGEVEKLEKCMQATYNLGRVMTALVKMNFKYPLELMGRAIAYGTHTK